MPLKKLQFGKKKKHHVGWNQFEMDEEYVPKRTRILWDSSTMKILKKEFFNCSRQSIHNALADVRKSNYRSVQAVKIRDRAIQLGLREKGEEVVKVLN